MEQSIQKFWDKQAGRYDRAEQQFSLVYNDIIVRTCKYLNEKDQVLDFGCATGNKTMELAKKVRHIHGLDISAEMIHQAIQKKDESELTNVSFSQGTLCNADFKKASFDKIVAFGIIHLLEDPEKELHRVNELLKPGGFFISTTACMKEKMAFKTRLEVSIYLLMKRLGISPLHINTFKTTDVQRLIISQNFVIVEAEMIIHGIPAIFIVARKEPESI